MSILATDNFNRADGGLGANWTTVTGEGSPAIVSNVVQTGATGTDSLAYYNAATWPNDQYSAVKLVTAATAFCGNGPVVRAAAGADTYYQLEGNFAGSGPAAGLRLLKRVAGTGTQLVQNSYAWSAGDTARLEIIGTTLTGYINGVSRITATDAALASGNAGLIVYVDSGLTLLAKIDDFEGGDFGGGAIVSRNFQIFQAVNAASTY